MGQEINCDQEIASANAVDEPNLFIESCGDEIGLCLLSEDGEARRRFLKQAMIAGGGLAGLSLLQGCEWDSSGLTGATTQPTSVNAIPVTLRINGKDYPL